jgi:hypothetical protein
MIRGRRRIPKYLSCRGRRGKAEQCQHGGRARDFAAPGPAGPALCLGRPAHRRSFLREGDDAVNLESLECALLEHRRERVEQGPPRLLRRERACPRRSRLTRDRGETTGLAEVASPAASRRPSSRCSMSSGRVNTRFSPQNRLAMKSGAQPSNTTHSCAAFCGSPARAEQAITMVPDRRRRLRLDCQPDPTHCCRVFGGRLANGSCVSQ